MILLFLFFPEQVHQQKWSEGVQSLQYAIRGYPSSADLWEVYIFFYQNKCYMYQNFKMNAMYAEILK